MNLCITFMKIFVVKIEYTWLKKVCSIMFFILKYQSMENAIHVAKIETLGRKLSLMCEAFKIKKNAVFWYVTPCGCCKNWHLRGM
jgi:hypothetical protein